jgi:hypothetical protein
MSTRLWEDTIILAIRDMQWIHALTSARPWPARSLIKFDGHPEEALGDLAMAQDQRFFLIEAKSSPSEFHTEWIRTIPGTRTKGYRPKQPYL